MRNPTVTESSPRRDALPGWSGTRDVFSVRRTDSTSIIPSGTPDVSGPISVSHSLPWQRRSTTPRSTIPMPDFDYQLQHLPTQQYISDSPYRYITPEGVEDALAAGVPPADVALEVLAVLGRSVAWTSAEDSSLCAFVAYRALRGGAV